jgi:glucuronosyltransferase
MLSAFPQKKPIPNFRDIEVTGIFDKMKNVMDNVFVTEGESIWESVNGVYDIGVLITNHTLTHPTVLNFLKSNEKFDLVICELFINEAMLGNVYIFNESHIK